MTKGPILIDLEQDEAEGPAPDTAPPVPDPDSMVPIM